MEKEMTNVRVVLVEGIGKPEKGSKPYTRIDVYIPQINGRELRVSAFLNGTQKQLIGLG